METQIEPHQVVSGTCTLCTQCTTINRRRVVVVVAVAICYSVNILTVQFKMSSIIRARNNLNLNNRIWAELPNGMHQRSGKLIAKCSRCHHTFRFAVQPEGGGWLHLMRIHVDYYFHLEIHPPTVKRVVKDEAKFSTICYCPESTVI